MLGLIETYSLLPYEVVHFAKIVGKNRYMTNLLSEFPHKSGRRGIHGSMPQSGTIVRWMYVGRVSVAISIFLAASFFFQEIEPAVLLSVSALAVASLLVTGVSVWLTEVRQAELGDTFLYLQIVFDLLLVTVVVRVTDGINSDFASLYILVIVVASLLLPIASSLLVTILAGILYFAVIFWFNQPQLSAALGFQLSVFATVALASSWIARRARVAADQKVVLEQEVKRLRLEAGDILSNLRSGIVSVDSEGYLVFANQAAEKLLGFDAAVAIGKESDEVFKGRAPGLGAVIRGTQEVGVGVQRFETEIVVDSGTFPIGVTTTVLDLPEQQGRSVTAIFSDISDQTRLEALKLRNERLEAVAELSASLAHEIKNPLASIRSSVEQLGGSMQAGEDERFLSQLVVRETDRLSGLLTEFLDFSRVRVTKSTRLRLDVLANSVAAMLRAHPDCASGSEIVVEAEEVALDGDEDLLHRVLFNLILNALQAAVDTARIVVEVREANASEVPAGVGIDCPVLLRVSDNGPGVPHELLTKLFEPFVSGRVGGSGLGLAIVQRAVEAHNGVVLVESTPQAGTTFLIFLPCDDRSEVVREST